MLMYLAQSYHEYFQNTNQNLYKTKKVKALKPEFYITYTGNQGRKPEKLSLSEEFFEGKDIDVEVKAKVLYETNKNGIINQYIIFCKVLQNKNKERAILMLGKGKISLDEIQIFFPEL